MEEFGCEVGEVANHKDNQWFDDPYFIREARDECSDEAMNDPYEGCADGDKNERS